MEKTYNAKLVPMGIGGYDIDFIIKDPNTGEISIATHIAMHLTTIKGIEYEAQRLIILNVHGTPIASYPNMPDTHCIDLCDVRRWIDEECPNKVVLSTACDACGIGEFHVHTLGDPHFTPTLTNNTVKMVWGNPIDKAKVMPDDYSGKTPENLNPFFKESGYPGTKKWEEWTKEQDEKKNKVGNNTEAIAIGEMAELDNNLFIHGPIFYECISHILEHIKSASKDEIKCRLEESLNQGYELVKQQFANAEDMAKAYANSRALPGNQQWHSAYNHYIAIENWRKHLLTIDWAAFVKARYPRACIKKEGIEFTVHCPLLNRRLSDFCQTEAEAWCSAKQRIRNKG